MSEMRTLLSKERRSELISKDGPTLVGMMREDASLTMEEIVFIEADLTRRLTRQMLTSSEKLEKLTGLLFLWTIVLAVLTLVVVVDIVMRWLSLSR